jgi:glycosyltransferase involved in cell wall biosynthesis
MEMHLGILSEQLLKRGYKPIVFCRKDSEIAKDARSRGIETVSFKPTNYVSPIELLRFFIAVKKYKIKLVHVHYSKDLWTTIPALKMAGKIPTVFIKHIGTQKPKTDIFHKAIYRNVWHIIAISKVIKENLLNTHPVKRENVSILYHGLDLVKFESAAEKRLKIRSEFGIAENDILIGTVGRLQIGKGHLEFIEMAAVLLKKYANLKFLIVGEPTRGEEDKAELIYSKAKELGINENLIFSGFRNDIPDVLAAMDIFAFPSHAEAFGLVVIEAMAAKLPVVSSNCDGILDIVDDQKTGLLVAPQNYSELSKAVETLVADKEKRVFFGQNGFQKVQEKFTIEKMTKNVEKIYADCLASIN